MTEQVIEKKQNKSSDAPTDDRNNNQNLLAPLSLVLAVAALIVAGFATWQTLSVKTLRQQNLSLLTQNQDIDRKTLQTLASTIQIESSTLQKQVDTLNKQLKETVGQTQFLQHDWQALKARYYLELANINLQWSDDIQTSITLLHSADELLQSIPDPEIHKVRQAIANEESELKAAAQTDLTGQMSQIDAARAMVSKLSFNGMAMPESETTKTQDKSTASGWKEHFNKSLNFLGKLVVIRHHQTDFSPVLSPLHKRLLIEALDMNLQTAQWAVLQNNPQIYKSALEQAMQIVQSNCPETDNQTKTLLASLAELKKVALRPQKPQLKNALPLLNQYLDAKTSRKDKPL